MPNRNLLPKSSPKRNYLSFFPVQHFNWGLIVIAKTKKKREKKKTSLTVNWFKAEARKKKKKKKEGVEIQTSDVFAIVKPSVDRTKGTAGNRLFYDKLIGIDFPVLSSGDSDFLSRFVVLHRPYSVDMLVKLLVQVQPLHVRPHIPFTPFFHLPLSGPPCCDEYDDQRNYVCFFGAPKENVNIYIFSFGWLN